jgi:acetyltransferase-like isoleucine patch superfamily enzyme
MTSFLISVPVIGRFIKKAIITREGGQMTSSLLREITRERYNTDVGLYSYGGCFASDFNVGGTVQVGRYCSIAKNVHYFGANHPINSITTSALFYNKKFGFEVKDVEREKLLIGNDVWIGYGVSITSSCHEIGDGAVIGAGSVVTKNVEPYEIVAGVPAKHIRYRFDDSIINKLESTRWFQYSPDELMKYYSTFENPDIFCKEINDKGLEDLNDGNI